MAVALEDFDDFLNEETFNLLGDTITYTPSKSGTFRAFVDYGDNAELLSGSRVVTGDCAVEVPVSQVAQPAGTDEIRLPRRAGQVFQPKQYLLNEAGDCWLIALKRKPA